MSKPKKKPAQDKNLRSKNLTLLGLLIGFVALIFFLTVNKYS